MSSAPVILLGAVIVIAMTAGLLGWLWVYRTTRPTRAEGEQLVAEIDALLPQTQCGQCGYPGCKPYARAIAEGSADINQCPPGGDQGIRKLAVLLGREYQPLNPAHGMEKPRCVAFIDENYCIGCTLCIQACPVDAIVGAAKQMHTIVADLCTGCELCVPPCPVDCISMLPVPHKPTRSASKYPLFEIFRKPVPDETAAAARDRHEFRQFREEREKLEKAARLAAKAAALKEESTRQPAEATTIAGATGTEDQKKALIAAAIARAQLQKSQVKPSNTGRLSAEQLAKIAEIEARRAGTPEAAQTSPHQKD